MKVSFMIIGAMKCGSTTLSEILRHHTQVEIFERETQFFIDTSNWKRDVKKYESYFTFPPGKITGESSTHYTKYPKYKKEVWEDIYEYNPLMKLIYIVRNPVDRALSQYMHMYERGYTDYSIEEAVRNIPEIINNGRYYTQIKPFLERFGPANLLIIDFDDLMQDRPSVIRAVAEFLNIDPDGFGNVGEVHENVTIGGGKWHHKHDQLKRRLNQFRGLFPRSFRNRVWDIITGRKRRAFREKPVMSPALRRAIIRMSELDLKELSHLTGKDFKKWLK